MLHPLKIDKILHTVHTRILGLQAIVQFMDLCSQLIQQPGEFQDRCAGFSGIVMTVHLYKMFTLSLIASSFARIWVADVRETWPCLPILS